VELEDYRRSAELFVSELTGEFYRHYAGLKDSFEIEPIYARHAGLFEAAAVTELRGLLAAAPPGSEERRRLTLLLDRGRGPSRRSDQSGGGRAGAA
jgi:hypothetical protein